MERSAGTMPAGAQLPGLDEQAPGGQEPGGHGHPRVRAALRHVLLLTGYTAAGVALTWPRAAYLAGRLPATRDVGGYVWGFWWVARQVSHGGDPWSTSYLAAPAGTQLAYHTLMPLPGLVMAPVTLAFGPSASYNLLSIVCPGLLCYVMYRTARLWLPAQLGAVAAGAFFGLSYSLDWRSFYEVNLAVGAVFLPLALAAAVRLRRQPTPGRAVTLGVVLAAALLTDQESAVLAVIVAGLAVATWLVWRPSVRKAALVVLAAGVFAAVASPQVIAMAQQALSGGATVPRWLLAGSYVGSGSSLVQLFAPSPRLASDGLPGLASFYYQGRPSFVATGYGVSLTLAALLGLAVAWRRPSARLLALLWLGSTVFALGVVPWLYDHPSMPLGVRWHSVRLSLAMPFTWFVRLPGMANFREADRFTELGLVAAALLAGAAVQWLRTRSRPLLAVLAVLALVEAGWPGNPAGHDPVPVMPTAMPRVDGPIAADPSHSLVVDVPFGIRGGLPVAGGTFPPQTMVLATADGHPLADAFISRVPAATLSGIEHRPFYQALMNAQGGPDTSSPALLRAARANARAMDVGWVLDWVANRAVDRLLRLTGFHQAYRVGRVVVWRASGLPVPSAGAGPPQTAPLRRLAPGR